MTREWWTESPSCHRLEDAKTGKLGNLDVNETTKVSRARAPIFLIFVVSRA
jgi:hypothetical protein